MYRFQMKHRGRLNEHATALQHVAYILRDTEGPAAAHVEYMLRQSEKTQRREDLIDSGSGNLPCWAHGEAMQYWEMVERYDTRTNARTATTWEVTLPRELKREEQLAAIQDLMHTQFGNRYTYTWALHESQALDGQPNPHFHVAYHSRVLDGKERTPEQFFADPRKGGLRKDTRIHARSGLLHQRQAWADIANWYLEKGGHAERVDARRLADQGIEREPLERLSAREMTIAKKTGVRSEGLQVREDSKAERQAAWASENARAVQAWDERKARLGVTPELARDAWLAKLRWERPFPRQGRDERNLGVDRKRIELILGNTRSKIYHVPGDRNYGDVHPKYQARFWSRAEAEAAGFRAARNQHYGPGTDEPMRREMGQARAERGSAPGSPSQRTTQALQAESAWLGRHIRDLHGALQQVRYYDQAGRPLPGPVEQRMQRLLREELVWPDAQDERTGGRARRVRLWDEREQREREERQPYDQR